MRKNFLGKASCGQAYSATGDGMRHTRTLFRGTIPWLSAQGACELACVKHDCCVVLKRKSGGKKGLFFLAQENFF
jgi:hypothetical protein